MNSSLLLFLANIGDSAVLLALTLVICLYLGLGRSYREAAALLSAFALSSALIGLLKLAFMGCSDTPFGLRSPSGHSALSMAVYGTYGLLISYRLRGPVRYLPLVLFPIIAGAIALSRVIMNLHTVSEVLLGALVGFFVIGTVWWFFLRTNPPSTLAPSGRPPVRLPLLIGLALLTIFLLQGTRLPAELFIGRLAGEIRANVPACQN